MSSVATSSVPTSSAKRPRGPVLELDLFRCTVCAGLEPQLLQMPCGKLDHKACRGCAEKAVELQRIKCFFCSQSFNASVEELREDPYHTTLVKRVKVACPCDGCQWTGPVHAFDRHVDEECDEMEVSCPLCGESMKRAVLKEHVSLARGEHVSMAIRNFVRCIVAVEEKYETTMAGKVDTAKANGEALGELLKDEERLGRISEIERRVWGRYREDAENLYSLQGFVSFSRRELQVVTFADNMLRMDALFQNSMFPACEHELKTDPERRYQRLLMRIEGFVEILEKDVEIFNKCEGLLETSDSVDRLRIDLGQVVCEGLPGKLLGKMDDLRWALDGASMDSAVRSILFDLRSQTDCSFWIDCLRPLGMDVRAGSVFLAIQGSRMPHRMTVPTATGDLWAFAEKDNCDKWALGRGDLVRKMEDTAGDLFKVLSGMQAYLPGGYDEAKVGRFRPSEEQARPLRELVERLYKLLPFERVLRKTKAYPIPVFTSITGQLDTLVNRLRFGFGIPEKGEYVIPGTTADADFLSLGVRRFDFEEARREDVIAVDSEDEISPDNSQAPGGVPSSPEAPGGGPVDAVGSEASSPGTPRVVVRRQLEFAAVGGNASAAPDAPAPAPAPASDAPATASDAPAPAPVPATGNAYDVPPAPRARNNRRGGGGGNPRRQPRWDGPDGTYRP